MTDNVQTNRYHQTSWSEEKKAKAGFDMSSFSRRMIARLKKVRGETDSSNDTFLARHNYYSRVSLA